MMAKRTDGPMQAFAIGYDAQGRLMNELDCARKVAAAAETTGQALTCAGSHSENRLFSH